MVTLVLLPGMDGTGDMFAPFLRALGPKYKTMVIGYPTSQQMDYAELVLYVKCALPSDEPFVLLGESFSGPIAICLAASNPQQLKGLILCCTFARNPYPAFDHLGAFIGMLPIKALPVRLLSLLLLGRFSSPALRLAFAESLARVSPAVLRTRLQSVMSVDVSAQLTAVKVPTLYLRASQDRIIFSVASQLISRVKPNTEIIDIDAPHFLLQAAPYEAARVVGAYIDELQGTL